MLSQSGNSIFHAYVFAIGSRCTARHVLLLAALGWCLPLWAHGDGLMMLEARDDLWLPAIPPYYLHSPCYPFVSCAEYQRWEIRERRLARERSLGEEGSTNRPAAPIRIAPANPKYIRPEYAESGSVKEEFRSSGEFLHNHPSDPLPDAR